MNRERTIVMTVAEMIEWLKTQDQDAILEIVYRERSSQATKQH